MKGVSKVLYKGTPTYFFPAPSSTSLRADSEQEWTLLLTVAVLAPLAEPPDPGPGLSPGLAAALPNDCSLSNTNTIQVVTP